MNPFKAFLFLLIIFFTFLLLLFLSEYRNVESNSERDELPVITDTVGLVPEVLPGTDSIENDSTETLASEVIKDTINNDTKLFHPKPFCFAESDSVHLRYLVRKMLDSTKQKLPVRIIYFGDSQIENDRITAELRRELQHEYGGKGPGFIPLEQLYNSSHQLRLDLSDSWEVKTFSDEDFWNQSLLFRNGLLTAENGKGWLRIKRIHSLNPQPDYRLMKLYYSLSGTCRLSITNSGDTIYGGNLPNDEQLGVLDLQFNRTPDDIKLDFETDSFLNVQGISLETRKGILVDNISLRGMSYPMFEWSEEKSIARMISKVNPGLFVMHFGVNLVPYQTKNYPYFTKHFRRQILFLKRNFPQVPVLVIGVSDMAKKENGVFTSYSNIPQIKAIQKELAEETNSIFWDLEAFMGGSGGMIRWVNASPSLGRKDYTHFSKEGAKVIGKELGRMILEACKNDSTAVE